jgi:hypothetical protein
MPAPARVQIEAKPTTLSPLREVTTAGQKTKVGSIKRFVLERLFPGEGERTDMKAMMQDYRGWCARQHAARAERALGRNGEDLPSDGRGDRSRRRQACVLRWREAWRRPGCRRALTGSAGSRRPPRRVIRTPNRTKNRSLFAGGCAILLKRRIYYSKLRDWPCP